MDKVVEAGLLIGSIIFLTLAVYFILIIGNANYAIAIERSINSQYEINKNTLTNCNIKVVEMVQVPNAIKDELTEVVDVTFDSLYGEPGLSPISQFIQEKNLNLDPEMYNNIQFAIESCRNELRTGQRRLSILKHQYENRTNSTLSGFFIKQAGYPRIIMDNYSNNMNGVSRKLFLDGLEETVKTRI